MEKHATPNHAAAGHHHHQHGHHPDKISVSLQLKCLKVFAQLTSYGIRVWKLLVFVCPNTQTLSNHQTPNLHTLSPKSSIWPSIQCPNYFYAVLKLFTAFSHTHHHTFDTHLCIPIQFAVSRHFQFAQFSASFIGVLLPAKRCQKLRVHLERRTQQHALMDQQIHTCAYIYKYIDICLVYCCL